MEATRNSDEGGVCRSFVQLRSGLAAGLWPALRASRLDPVESPALRMNRGQPQSPPTGQMTSR